MTEVKIRQLDSDAGFLAGDNFPGATVPTIGYGASPPSVATAVLQNPLPSVTDDAPALIQLRHQLTADYVVTLLAAIHDFAATKRRRW